MYVYYHFSRMYYLYLKFHPSTPFESVFFFYNIDILLGYNNYIIIFAIKNIVSIFLYNNIKNIFIFLYKYRIFLISNFNTVFARNVSATILS